MNKQLREIMEKLTTYWAGLNKRQRRNLIAVVGILVIVAGLLTSFGLQKHYVAAFSNLDDASAGEVITKLKDMGVEYKLVGNTIEVPEGVADQVRVQLAMANIPKSGTIGYPDLFNQSGLGGMTDTMFNAKYQAVLEGNLSTTIRSIDGVNNAKVQLVLPQDKMFVQQQTNDAKASVLLELRPGVNLAPAQVAGIQQLVAHSVKGLLPENVTVIDQRGMRISQDPQDSAPGSLGASAKQLDITNQIERSTENKIRDAIEGMVGAGNVKVTVNADVSFDQIHQVDNVVKPVVGPDQGLVISEQKSSSSSQGTGPAGGAAGTPTGAPGGGGNNKGAASTNSTTSSAQSTTNYEVNRSTVDTVHQAYKVNQYTVGVVVNGNLTPQQKADIQALAASTVGALTNNASINNQITVVSSNFKATPPTFSVPFYQNSWIMGGLAFGALLLGAGLILLGRRRAKLAAMDLPEEAPVTPTLVMEETEQNKMKKQLEKLAEQKPEEFVNLLRTWLLEE